jgi:hypothetical protein
MYGYKFLDASGLVKSGSGVLHTVVLSGGTTVAVAAFYDETSGSGDVLAVVKAAANTTVGVALDVVFGVGCYVTLSGTSPSCTVGYL